MASEEWWSADDPAVFGPVAVDVNVGEMPRHVGDYVYAKWESDDYLKPGIVCEESLLLLDRDGETTEIDAGYVLQVVRPQGDLAGKVLLDHRWPNGTMAPTRGPFGRTGRLGVLRETLANMLRRHGEDDLAERVLSITDDELKRIGELGFHYAFSEQAMALGGSMGAARALSLATIDVLEEAGRDLRWQRTQNELEIYGWSAELSKDEIDRDLSLRLHAATEQQPPSGA